MRATTTGLHVDPILFGYRVNTQASTKLSPFELLYGVKARLPVDVEQVDVGTEECSTDVVQQRVIDLAESCVRVREEGAKNIEASQQAQKLRYDLKHAGPTYKVGDMVMKFNRRRETRMGGKLAPIYTGPYKIAELVGTGCFRICDADDKVLKQVVNAVNLKPYNAPHSPSVSTRSPVSAAKRKPPQSDSPSTPTAKRLLTMETTSPPPPTPPANTPWLPDLNLNMADKEVIVSGAWLNDKIIDAVNKMAEFQSGGDANQTTLLVQGSFRAISGDVIQILHDTNHWVAVTVRAEEILYADSAQRPISAVVAEQLRQLFRTRKNADGRLAVVRVPCDPQPNGSDCGVYAAAFAAEWASGSLACDVGFDHSQMRLHLVKCLEKGVLDVFPKSGVKRRGRKRIPIKHMV
jgi:hypothetical protein